MRFITCSNRYYHHYPGQRINVPLVLCSSPLGVCYIDVYVTFVRANIYTRHGDICLINFDKLPIFPRFHFTIFKHDLTLNRMITFNHY